MSDLDMRKVEKIPHPIVDEFANKHWELQREINARVKSMSDSEVQRLRLSLESLTSINCWFAEQDVKPMLLEGIIHRDVTKQSPPQSHEGKP